MSNHGESLSTTPAKDPFRLLAWPSLIWYFGFFVVPLGLVLLTSFLTRGTYGGLVWEWQVDTYQRIFEPAYVNIFWRSLKLSSYTTALCLFISVPTAWVIATLPPSRRWIWLTLVSLPFFMNLIIRIYAIRVFLGFDGPVMSVAHWLGWEIDPFLLSQNQWVTMYGMVTSYLPFMVFPLYSAFEKMDWSLIEAAMDLGASPWRTLFKVILPNLRVALSSGILMVFVPALGEFVIPDLLGGAKVLLIGNLITDQFLKSRDWPFGATLTIHLVMILGFFSFVILKWGRQKR